VSMQPFGRISGLVVLGSIAFACSGTDSQGPASDGGAANGAGGNTGNLAGTGGSSSAVSGTTGGAVANSTGGSPTGGAPVGTGGRATGGAPGATGGRTGTGGATGAGGTSAGVGGAAGAGTGGCTVGTWPTGDPSVAGPYAVTLEENIGPTAGTENAHFDVIRPTDLTKTNLCHPLITWGNGHGDNPPTYMVLLKQLASHGFVVVASLTKTASQGTPLPQVAGIDWILQENDTPTSIYYKRIDTTHIGANGHSEGGMASTMTGSDARVKAIATLCGARANANLHGPALLLCGGADTIATCSGMQSAFDGITQPVMLANQLTATHGSWIGSIKDPFMIAVTAWMRLHLMDDTAQRKMFYGPTCTLCTNTAIWKVQQKGMDQ
jgi:hypothetical protein